MTVPQSDRRVWGSGAFLVLLVIGVSCWLKWRGADLPPPLLPAISALVSAIALAFAAGAPESGWTKRPLEWRVRTKFEWFVIALAVVSVVLSLASIDLGPCKIPGSC